MISDLARTACSRLVLPEREEERVDLGWVLKVCTESEMLRSGLVFLMGSLNHHWKTETFPTVWGSGSPASLQGLCCPRGEPADSCSGVHVLLSSWGFLVVLVHCDLHIFLDCSAEVMYTCSLRCWTLTRNSSFSVTWSFASTLNI